LKSYDIVNFFCDFCEGKNQASFLRKRPEAVFSKMIRDPVLRVVFLLILMA
jgi:hypothetical protein